MNAFKYAAKKSSGQTVEGTIQADDRNQALAELRKQNLVVLKVEQVGGAAAPAADGKPKRGIGLMFQGGPKASQQELVLFTRQLSTMVSSGLALLESIEVLGEQAETPGMKKTCVKIATELRSGSDLSSAMEQCPRAFSPLYISMVRAGEASGQMDVILARLADYLESSATLKREIRAAMTYPVISLVLVLGITAFLMLGVVPTFRQVFDGLGAELPSLTKFVLGVSETMKNNWIAIFGGGFGFCAAIWIFMKTEVGGLVGDTLAFKAPVFGPLARKVALARFSRTFATLIRSGVPIMGTLDIVAETAGNRLVTRAVVDSKESVRNGQLLSEPLGKSKVFPPMVVRMIAIGERTGALEALLEKIAEFYDAQVKAAIKSLTSLIEPILISFMGVIVGGVVLSVFLPILDIVGKLGGS
ncbi:MAG: type II secretion system F family protein [Planctomycetes bacterium]|nr:type II secretion system F family protein [Planctomycetota bacterium]